MSSMTSTAEKLADDLDKLAKEFQNMAKQLRATSMKDGSINPWVTPLYTTIQNHPGISRTDLANIFADTIPANAYRNAMTTLRRRGWIHNRGTRKHPSWYSVKPA